MAGRANCPFRTADLGAYSLNVTPSGGRPRAANWLAGPVNEDVQRAIFIAGDRSNPTRSERVIAAPLHMLARPVMAEVALFRSDACSTKKNETGVLN